MLTTLFSIALSVAQVSAHPLASVNRRHVATRDAGAGCAKTYTVVRGDVCHAIAKAHGMSTKDFMAANAFIDSQCMHLQIGAQVCVGSATAGAGNGTALANGTATANLNAAVSVSSIQTGNKGTSSDGWKLATVHQGKTFFDGFDFYGDWSSSDPTHGQVSYVNAAAAWSQNLVSVSDKTATMTLQQGSNMWTRNAVRIHSKEHYNAGTLWLLDAKHMPAGNGLWPAFWSVGARTDAANAWPRSGEIDIVEYFNQLQTSTTSFHSSEGCSMQSTGFSGTVGQGGTYCDSASTGNSGCGVETDSPVAESFNKMGGGVYALLWTADGISTYFFARDKIPDDITAGSPVPSSWGVPTAKISGQSCDLAARFHDHAIVFNITSCGDLAGSAFPGGAEACKAYMANADLSEAYWEVNSLQIFKQ